MFLHIIVVSVIFIFGCAVEGLNNKIKLNESVNEEYGRRYKGRNMDHVHGILHSTESIKALADDGLISEVLNNLVKIYNSAIKPMEEAYKYHDINPDTFGEADIFSIPKVVFIGPWSTGKSSLISYLLDIENSSYSLPTGAQPTTTDFTILSYDEEPKTISGSVIVMDNNYSALEKFGQNFLERLKSVHIPKDLLKMVNFIDTPGVMENQDHHKRSYPFTEVSQWFINHSDLVVLVFDPTKLNVGRELGPLFKHLKNQDTKVKIVLNKADTLSPEELLRIYGTLFWNLSPLINSSDPPTVHIGSFWSKKFNTISGDYQDFFVKEEKLLLHEIYDVMCNLVENKIAKFRKHAVKVRNHAIVVDQYLKVLKQEHSIFRDIHDVALGIIYSPDEYQIFNKVLTNPSVSEQDLFSSRLYRNFFSLHPINSFTSLTKQCGLISSCMLDTINYAIYNNFLSLLEYYESEKKFKCQKSTDAVENVKHEKEKYFESFNN